MNTLIFLQKLNDQSIEEFSRHEIGLVYGENSLNEMVEDISSLTDKEILINKIDIDKFFNKYFY